MMTHGNPTYMRQETPAVSCNRLRENKLALIVVTILHGLVLAFWLQGSSLEGAEPPSGPVAGAPSSEPQPPHAVAPAEIALRSDEAKTRLQQIESQLADYTTIDQLDQADELLKERMERWWKDRGPSLDRPNSVMEVNDVARELGNFQAEITQLDAADEKIAREIALLQSEVEGILAVWQQTRAAVLKTRTGKPIQERVAQMLKEAIRVDSLVKERAAKLLDLDNRISEKQKAAAEFARRIEKARVEVGAELFVLDSPPLWQAIWKVGDGQALAGQAQESRIRLVNQIKTFFEDYGPRLPYDSIIFLAVLACLYLIRRAIAAELAGKAEFAFALKLLAQPFSVGLLFIFFLALVLYTKAAGEIIRVMVLFTVIPVARLIPSVISSPWRRANYLLVGLYLLEFFRVSIPAASLLHRLLLFGLDCFALGFAVWLLRARGREIASAGRKGGILLFLLRAATLLLVVAIIANLIGNLSLASFLTSATLRGSYLALLLQIIAELLAAVTSLALQTRFARLSLLVREHGAFMTARCAGFYRVVAVLLWLGAVAYLFGFLGGLFSRGTNFLTRRWQVGATSFSFEDLVTFVLVLLVAAFFSRLVRFVFREEVFPRIRLPRGIPGAVDMLSNYAIMAFGFLLALAAAGVDLSRVTLVVSALGVGLGFGLQNMVSNFVSGLVLAFGRPIQIGDTVEVGSLLGKVRGIGFRASVVRTFDGAEVIIPNGELVWAKVINWSLSDQNRRIEIAVGVAYGTDPNRVLEILLDVAAKHQNLLHYPAPDALFEGFGDSSLNFKLRCWTQLDDFLRVRSELNVAVNNAFQAEGITIPFPQRDVHFDWPGMPKAEGDSCGTKELPPAKAISTKTDEK